ncbi:KAP family P-loop NTPase fold protein [Sinorhizobium meliloti]|uniref:KAP family P-loop NTPase fold protein n=1 Tax=Rhizobium meliloti TaxID=382 RepID=UPI003F1351C4
MSILLCLKNWWFGRRDTSSVFDAEIGSDVPIRSAEQDELRRASFAERIAVILSELSLDEGRVFAVRGAWGAGKSSLKNLIIEQLKARRDGTTWLEFNPWQWGDGDIITKALFEQIADKLGGPFSPGARKRAAKFRRYGAVLTGSGAALKATGGNSQLISQILANASVVTLAASIGWDLPTVATIAGAFAVASLLVPLFGRALLHFGRDIWSEPLDKIRASLEASLRELKQPLVVFVDDIDRLEPQEIRLLVRQIKVNANLPNIAFVLLFQPSIVESALDPIANGKGEEFLKKIVQAHFDLPAVPRSTVYGILTKELDRLVGQHATTENGFEEVRWGNALVGVIQPFIKNLRDARRYLSSVSIHIPLHVGKKVLEVNIIDFLTLEALRVFEPQFHGALFGEQDLLLQRGRFRGEHERDARHTRLQALLLEVSEANRPTVETTVKLLFPRAESALGGMEYDEDWASSWSASKRVCSFRFFGRYFELQTASGDISENEFNDLLEVTNDEDLLRVSLESIEHRGLLPSLAARLDEAVSRLPTESAETLLPAMFEVAQKLASHDGESFASPWTSAWRAISWYIDRLPEETRGDLTLMSLSKTGALSVGAIVIYLNDPSAQKRQSRIEPKLDKKTVDLLKEEWLRQIRERAKDAQGMLSEGDLGYYLYRWQDYAGSLAEPRDWVQTTIENDQHFIQFVSQLMSSGTSHTIGDLVSSRIDMISWETVDQFIGADYAAKRLAKLSTSDLSPRQERAIAALERSLQEGARDEGATADQSLTEAISRNKTL